LSEAKVELEPGPCVRVSGKREDSRGESTRERHAGVGIGKRLPSRPRYPKNRRRNDDHSQKTMKRKEKCVGGKSVKETLNQETFPKNRAKNAHREAIPKVEKMLEKREWKEAVSKRPKRECVILGDEKCHGESGDSWEKKLGGEKGVQGGVRKAGSLGAEANACLGVVFTHFANRVKSHQVKRGGTWRPILEES